jgi:hypothetical protein
VSISGRSGSSRTVRLGLVAAAAVELAIALLCAVLALALADLRIVFGATAAVFAASAAMLHAAGKRAERRDADGFASGGSGQED